MSRELPPKRGPYFIFDECGEAHLTHEGEVAYALAFGGAMPSPEPDPYVWIDPFEGVPSYG